ncbi:MAG TPA: aminoglycoside phosphotransferase family protein [Pseudonocardiaceae bacterium]|nr:aminoglycoside phosphotransferase family protein [Pseudonocardiaceae bacterium]
MITIPESFRARFVRSADPAERRWIAELPELVGRLCETWSLRPDGAPMHGYVGLVLPVLRPDGTAAMLKVSHLDADSRDEPVALAGWGGRGAVRLLDRDDAYGALLLERLDSSRSLHDHPIGPAVTVAAELLRRLTVPTPPLHQTLTGLAARWAEEFPAENAALGRPVPPRLLDAAVDHCRQLGPAAAALMVNQDLHYYNVLPGEREPWLLIDPKVLTGDPEFGVIPLLWNRFSEADGPGAVRSRLAAIAEVAGLDLDLARHWTLVRAVDNWLWAAARHEPFPHVWTCAAIAAAVAG